MPAATTRNDLIALTRKEYEKLDKLLDSVSPDDAAAPDDEDTSIRDVIAHRAHWAGLFLGWYEDGQAGKAVEIPAPGYKWNELKRYNAMLRQRSRSVARNSLHVKGQAADLRLKSRSVNQMAQAAAACAAGGVGRYSRSNFVHMDCGVVRSWGR